MVASLAIEPVSPGSANLLEFRYRSAMGERTVIQDSTQKLSTTARPGDRDRPFDKKAMRDGQPVEVERDRTSDFAAAVIAGAMRPTPQSMEELLRRIGSAEIPEESQARLKDLIA